MPDAEDKTSVTEWHNVERISSVVITLLLDIRYLFFILLLIVAKLINLSLTIQNKMLK